MENIGKILVPFPSQNVTYCIFIIDALLLIEDAFGEDRSDNRIKSQYRRGSRIRRGGSRIRPGGNICGAGW